MKRLLGKIAIGIAGTLTVFGLNFKDVKAVVKPHPSITKVSETTPLYLTHGKEMSSKIDQVMSWHESHQSHMSHQSHQSHMSHQSHYSHYSSY